MKEHPTRRWPLGSLLRASALAAGLLFVAGSAPGQLVNTATAETSTGLLNQAMVFSQTTDDSDFSNNFVSFRSRVISSATVETAVLPLEEPVSVLEIPTLSTVAGVLLGGLLAALGLLTLRRQLA